MDVCHVCGHPYEPGTRECPYEGDHPSRPMLEVFKRTPVKYVYVVGPYAGDDEEEQENNVRVVMVSALVLLRAGYIPLISHAVYSVEMLTDDGATEQECMDYRLGLVERADAVVVTGMDHGVRVDLARAAGLGIPVYHGIKAFFDVYGANE